MYKLAAPRIVFFFGQHLSRDYWPPGHENPAMGFFWGVDQDEMPGLLEFFFWRFRPQKTGKIFTVCFGPASQSIGRGRISQEGALDHRESRERRDKIFAAKTENAKNFKKKLDQENSF